MSNLKCTRLIKTWQDAILIDVSLEVYLLVEVQETCRW